MKTATEIVRNLHREGIKKQHGGKFKKAQQKYLRAINILKKQRKIIVNLVPYVTLQMFGHNIVIAVIWTVI